MSSSEELFEKKFSFESSPSQTSINSEQLFIEPIWNLHETQHICAEFEKVRTRLNDKNIKKWGFHTSKSDLSLDVVRKFRKIEVELRFRTWLKLTEILYSYPVLDLDEFEEEVNAGFLCEAPGCFITATNHYVKLNKPRLKLNWIGSTLNPYYEGSDFINIGIRDDRFIRRTFDHWHFGKDDIGDILSYSFVDDFVTKFSRKFDFISADGGINCINNPSQQETVSYPLQFHEFLVAVNCLKVGGSLVLKLFNLFTSQLCCLVYLMYEFFEQVHLIKPSTSKAGNSEVYAVCLKMKKDSLHSIHILTQTCMKKNEENSNFLSVLAILPRAQISYSFLDQFLKCSGFFTNAQQNAILANLNLFDLAEAEPAVYNEVRILQRKISDLYFRKFPCESIPPKDRILSRPVTELYPRIPKDWKLTGIVVKTDLYDEVFESESFNLRTQKQGPDYQKLSDLLNQSYSIEAVMQYFLTYHHRGGPRKLSEINLSINCGKVPEQVINSPWIHLDTLYIYNHLINLTKDLKPVDKAEAPVIDPKLFYKLVEDGRGGSFFESDIFFPFLTSAKLYNFSTYSETLEDGSEYEIVAIYARSHTFYNSDDERVAFFQLVQGIIRVSNILGPNDILILNINPPLRRLWAGVLYLLTLLYNSMAILPIFSFDQIEKVDLADQGMLIVYSSVFGDLSTIEDFDTRKNFVIKALTKAYDFIEAGVYPLEIMSISNLISGKTG